MAAVLDVLAFMSGCLEQQQELHVKLLQFLLTLHATVLLRWPCIVARAVDCWCRGVEVEVCKARLGLARVSVVRGEGPHAGDPLIDDYIRSLETITDYLTKWSGLVS